MNALSNLDETYREYSLAPIDDMIRFWRSKIKDQIEVTAGRRGGKSIQVDAAGCRCPSTLKPVRPNVCMTVAVCQQDKIEQF